MRTCIPIAAAVILSLAAHVAHAQESLPLAITGIIDAAAEDPDTLSAVVKAIKKANPASAAEIDAYAASLTKRLAAEKLERTQDKGFFSGWTSEIELGGAINTGNTVDDSFAGIIALDRVTPLWEHEIDLRVSHKSEDGNTTTNRYFATYSIVRNLGPRYYLGAILWAERDPFAGYDYRFSEGLGVGYRLVQKTDLTLALEGGVALRQSDFLDRGYEATTAARMAGYVTWRIMPRLTFKQDLVGYMDRENNTILSTTSLTSRQWGNVASRLSYEVRHEQNPPAGREPTDTTSRVSLVFTY